MTQVEQVALWAGLIAGVVSIALATVAIAFSWAVDRRAQAINTQMIQSLQKIESTVEGVSSDTTGLIKVAWDRLLPGDSRQDETPSHLQGDEESVRQIAAGVAAELRAELANSGSELAGDVNVPPSPEQVLERLDETVHRLEQTVRTQLRTSPESSPGRRFDRVYRALDRATSETRELARALQRGHLDRLQYGALGNTELREAMTYLRREGILIPLKGSAPAGDEIPVYWFSPAVAELMSSVMSMFDADTPAAERVHVLLSQVGYFGVRR